MKTNVSAVLPAADLQAAIQSIQQAEMKLPFLITLSEEERKKILKMGAKSVDFVGDAYETSKTFPTILPPSFDKAEFTKDTDLIKALVSFKMYVDALQQKVDDTLLEVGSEAMFNALRIYNLAEAQQDNVPGLRSAVDKMKERFKKRRKKKEENPELKIG